MKDIYDLIPYGDHDNDNMYSYDPSCVCPRMGRPHRWLQDNNNNNNNNNDDSNNSDGATWEIVYTCLVLAAMFVALISDRIGADSVMLAALTAFMASEIISVQEGLTGFSNQGLLTVLILFVVADGISKTGALDWYMTKLLGHPASTAAAQLKLMIPIAVVSAFLNNTPVVVVMIPIVQRWAKNIHVSPKQLLIPLSFASILGGTCTLIGTSTNLVVQGLLSDRYPDNTPNAVSIGLFDLGQYGVPVAMAGIAYVLLVSPFLLPGGTNSTGTNSKNGSAAEHDNLIDSSNDILLGARLTQWSPAAGRSVQRSNLRDTGGIYLVSVHRAATGNVHRAVSSDFVLNVGDTLYFTGLVEGFGDFCEEHGLEVVTNEVEEATILSASVSVTAAAAATTTTATTTTATTATVLNRDNSLDKPSPDDPLYPKLDTALPTVTEVDDDDDDDIPIEVGVTKESLLQADYDVRLRNIHRMTDLIRGVEPSEEDTSTIIPLSLLPMGAKSRPRPAKRRQRQVSGTLRGDDPAKIVVTIDKELVVVGINAHDRAGFLLDISKGLLRLNLQLHHTEAAVREERSLSIWRCESIGTEIPDLEEIWSVLNALLSVEGGVEAIKKRGLRVIRARVLKGSRLVGMTATELDFRKVYKAAIIAVRKGSVNITTQLLAVRFDVGDILVLQASDDSPLLSMPPDDFYKRLTESIKEAEMPSRRVSSVRGLVNMVTRKSTSHPDLGDLEHLDDAVDKRQADSLSVAMQSQSEDDFFVPSGNESDNNVGNESDSNVLIVDEEAFNVEAGIALDEVQAVWKDLAVLFLEEGQGTEAASREFLTAMTIAPHSQLAKKSVIQNGINKLPDLYLVSIDRPSTTSEDKKKPKLLVRTTVGQDTFPIGESSDHEGSLRTETPAMKAVSLDEPLQEGDILWFSGSATAVGDLRKIPGLVSNQDDEVKKINDKVHDRRLVQAVIARKSPLVGHTVSEARFGTRYGAAVIAVHREGQRVHEQPAKIKLQAGDVLLLEAGPSFIGRGAENDRSFALLAEVEDSAPPRLRLLIPALAITAAMLIVFMAGVASLLVCGLVASILMVVFGILSEAEARNAVNWDIYITIASAFGIGQALINSGVADAIANFLVDVGTAIGIGDAGLLGAVYFATFLISNVVTNNAAAALIFPIAMDAAEQTGIDTTIMAYTLMLGASASFMSPFGYTTNLLIYGPGGYKYKDFLLFGSPMQLVLWLLSISYLSVIEPWYLSWLGTGLVLIIVSVARIGIGTGIGIGDKIKARIAASRKKGSTPEAPGSTGVSS